MDPQQQGQLNTILQALAYFHQPQVSHELNSMCYAYPGAFRISTSRLEDGKSSPLLCLDGTLPVTYRGAMYNIPIKIWFKEDYPMTAPICMVVPTQDMLVKPGQHVNAAGWVSLAYLQNWNPKDHTLVDTAKAMQNAFGLEPPVYAKPASMLQPQRPPKPIGGVDSSSPPRKPPKPGGSAALRHHDTAPMSHNLDTPPPLPPKHGLDSSPVKALRPVQTSPVRYDTTSTYSSLAASHSSQLNSQTAPRAMTYHTPPLPSGETLSHLQQFPSNRNMSASSSIRHDEKLIVMDDEELRLHTARSAVALKVKKYMAGRKAETDEKLRALDIEMKELALSGRVLDNALQHIREQEARIDANVRLKTMHANEMRDAIGTYESCPPPPVDDMVMSPWPLYEQLVKLVAEDNGITDTLFYLARALDKGVVGLDMYLKSVRVLSRQQFNARALIGKARDAAGLSSL